MAGWHLPGADYDDANGCRCVQVPTDRCAAQDAYFRV
jgi:hypothetical protein